MFATWLDDRGKGKRLYGASSKDGGASWSRNVLIYESPSGTICQCCHPTAIIEEGVEIPPQPLRLDELGQDGVTLPYAERDHPQAPQRQHVSAELLGRALVRTVAGAR